MKLTEKQFNILQIVLLGYPLILILIPRAFGYFLYSPLNKGWLVGVIWILLGVLTMWKYQKSSKRLWVGLSIISVIPYIALASFHLVGSRMEFRSADEQVEFVKEIVSSGGYSDIEITCSIDSYFESGAGGSFFFGFGSSTGGGGYIDSSIPNYVRRFNQEEKILWERQNCAPTLSR